MTRVVMVVAALALLIADPAGAHPTPNVRFALAGSSLGNLRESDEWMARHHMDTAIVDVTGDEFGTQNQVPAGWLSTPAVKYESYATFVAHTDGDASNGELAAGITRVKYNPEQWADTPLAEQQDPPLYMRLFCQRAAGLGLDCGNAPARTLMQVSGSVYTCTGTLTERYLRCDVAGDAARYATHIDVQMQAHQNDPTAYEAHVRAAFADAVAANPTVRLRANLSTSLTGTTASSLCTARRVTKDEFGASPEGHWFHVSDATSKIGTDFLGLLHNGKC